MDYALVNMGTCCMEMEIFKMSIMIDLFLLAYLMAMVLLTVLGVMSVLTAIFTPEWSAKRAWLMRHQKK